MQNILEDFPVGYTPNIQQTTLLSRIDNAFKSGRKFVICSAPTGTGKSFIAKTLANRSNLPSKDYVELVNSFYAFKQGYEQDCKNQPPFGAFVLTITKALQDQYADLFKDTKLIKGQSNYQCMVDEQYSVDIAPCVHIKSIREDCWSSRRCPYYQARNEALIGRFSALNYKMFFALPEQVKKREYLICDEASELEEEFIREFSCAVNLDLLKVCDIKVSYAYVADYSKMLSWVSEVLLQITDKAKEIEQRLNKLEKLSKFLETEKSKMIQLKNLVKKLMTLIETWTYCEYIIEKDKNNIKFTPLKVEKLTNELFKYADKVLLMSATIIDPQHFAKTLGITDFEYIEVDSSFDAKKSPIYVLAKNKLNARNLQEKLPGICQLISKICDKHTGEKGLIHTHTLEITKYLQLNLRGNRWLFREPGVSNEDILKAHSEISQDTVLVSPSMVFGVDLKGELATFQIIIKAPYLPLLDKRIKKMFDLDKTWYENRMISSFIQACGRGTRSKKDTCTTYVLDGNIADAIIRCRTKVPKYFLERFV